MWLELPTSKHVHCTFVSFYHTAISLSPALESSLNLTSFDDQISTIPLLFQLPLQIQVPPQSSQFQLPLQFQALYSSISNNGIFPTHSSWPPNFHVNQVGHTLMSTLLQRVFTHIYIFMYSTHNNNGLKHLKT